MGFQTDVEKRINLGQDINNSWAIVAQRQPDNENIALLFQEIFTIVRRESRIVRDREADK